MSDAHRSQRDDVALLLALICVGGCWALVPDVIPRTGYDRSRNTLIAARAGLLRQLRTELVGTSRFGRSPHWMRHVD
ncbi:hypothetical protein ACH4E8_26370 [Streptomyces sp. NPDC017979]|uniref:hypothetical protein n=1 Tax=Streptomyces sp. NPDC017979 TaxID=3365024 RepID=UPI0037A8D32F